MGSGAEPYGMQTMPVIMREIYVDGTASTNPISGDPTMLAFNLNPTMVGWLKGLVVDELNSQYLTQSSYMPSEPQSVS